MTTAEPTIKEMLDELILNGNERRDHIGLLEKQGKRLPEEIRWRRLRLQIYRAAVDKFKEVTTGGDHDSPRVP